jgi:hypothetical protein
LSGDGIQRVVQPMALFLALTMFQYLIDGLHNRELRASVISFPGVTEEQ